MSRSQSEQNVRSPSGKLDKEDRISSMASCWVQKAPPFPKCPQLLPGAAFYMGINWSQPIADRCNFLHQLWAWTGPYGTGLHIAPTKTRAIVTLPQFAVYL